MHYLLVITWLYPQVAEGTACGMNYLHRREPFPTLHRDLKSASILLDGSFNVKICHFDLAFSQSYLVWLIICS